MQGFPKSFTDKENIEHFKLAKNGDEKAKEKLKIHNLRLVVQRVNSRFKNTYLEFDDLFSIGVIGLIKAVNTFDIDKKVKFATYAVRCIDNEILMALRNRKKMNKDISLYDHVYQQNWEGQPLTYEDLLTDGKDIIEDLVIEDMYQDIYDAFNMLKERDRKILKMRFGIGCAPMSQSEIAKALNLSQSYVSRLEKAALKQLEKYFRKIEKGHINNTAKVLCKTK